MNLLKIIVFFYLLFLIFFLVFFPFIICLLLNIFTLYFLFILSCTFLHVFFFHFGCLLFLWFFYFRRYFSFYTSFPDTFFFPSYFSLSHFFSSNKLISLSPFFLISKKKKFLFFLSFCTFCISNYYLLYASYFGFRLLILIFFFIFDLLCSPSLSGVLFLLLILFLHKLSSSLCFCHWSFYYIFLFVFLVCMKILHWEKYTQNLSWVQKNIKCWFVTVNFHGTINDSQILENSFFFCFSSSKLWKVWLKFKILDLTGVQTLIADSDRRYTIHQTNKTYLPLSNKEMGQDKNICLGHLYSSPPPPRPFIKYSENKIHP